jgi:hypothetical protein
MIGLAITSGILTSGARFQKLRAGRCPSLSRTSPGARYASGMKKLVILIVVVLGGFAVWRKVQAQRADLDLWSEATSSEDY